MAILPLPGSPFFQNILFFISLHKNEIKKMLENITTEILW